jgi:hypothetical protein
VVAANRDIDPKSLTLEDQPGITRILAGVQSMMTMFAEDAVPDYRVLHH